MLTIINLLRIGAGLCLLLVASYCDIKDRKVNNEIFILMVLFGITLGGLEYLIFTPPVSIYLMYLLTILIITSLAIGLYYGLDRIKQPIGGADVKCMIALSILFPQNIFFVLSILGIGCFLGLITMLMGRKEIPLIFYLLMGLIISILLFFW